MDLFDPLLNPYHCADEADGSALTPQEMQAYRRKKQVKSHAPLGEDFSE